MRPDQWDRVQELLDRAAQLPQEDHREFLQKECADDAEVIREVESLLGYGSVDLLSDEELTRLAAAAEHPDRIDGYRITRVLGEGGMGVVYEAEQDQPVRRTVAIKLIKLGMDTRQVVARFDTERQALALMNHSNIARVYDAGVAERGRPYFVMEYVEGVPIMKYCDTARLSARQRLELFVQICEGIHHAHQKGIIHRDVKPSNVLVTMQDGRPVPKIIDFGIAKATDQRMVEATMVTQLGQVVGTLAYMSPEQASLTGQGVDIRTDVYSLGVLLYELLVGRLPFDPTGKGATFEEVCRQIREVDPPRPSARYTSLGKASDEIAARRRTDPRSFVRALRGDLDWIVMKTLEKDPERRYAAASELATDVRRHLAHEPVAARPPATLYRLRKFARRHRVGVASATVIGVLLVVASVGTSVGLVRARRAERSALDAQGLALKEAKTSERIADYFVGIFRLADPDHARVQTITAREILDARAESVREDLREEPGVRGRVMAAMGEAYMGLGLYGEARKLFDEALPLLRESFGDEHEEVYNVLNELGQLSSQMEDYEAALGYLEEALAVAERTVGPDHPHVPPIVKNLGDVNVKLGNLDAARRYLERALDHRIATYGPESRSVARTLSSLASLAVEAGDYEGGISLAERSLAIRQAILQPGDPGVAYGHLFLADAQFLDGRYEEARENLEAARGIWQRTHGPEHRLIGECLIRLAKVRSKLGDPGAAYADYRGARSIVEKAFDANEPGTARALVESLEEYSDLLVELGRPEEAARTRAEAVSLRERHGLAP